MHKIPSFQICKIVKEIPHLIVECLIMSFGVGFFIEVAHSPFLIELFLVAVSLLELYATCIYTLPLQSVRLHPLSY